MTGLDSVGQRLRSQHAIEMAKASVSMLGSQRLSSSFALLSYIFLKPGPHQQQCRSNVRLCRQKRQQCRASFALKFCPLDKVERCFDSVALTLLLVWTGLKTWQRIPTFQRQFHLCVCVKNIVFSAFDTAGCATVSCKWFPKFFLGMHIILE